MFNVGTKDEMSIKSLSKLIADYVGFKGKILFDKKSPDGTYRKNLDSSRINSFGWTPDIRLKDGLKRLIDIRKNNNLNEF